jgi:shikimate kinase
MGVGKTAVGKRLAKRLGRPFVDTDQLIEEREGMTIAEIFERQGEKAFRRVEREVVASLAPPVPAVIATGGGTFVDKGNRARLRALGVVVCLVTRFETLIERVGRGGKRPLATGDAAERLAKLYEARMPVYRQADVLIETDGLSVDQSVSRVLTMIEHRLKADQASEGEPS